MFDHFVELALKGLKTFTSGLEFSFLGKKINFIKIIFTTIMKNEFSVALTPDFAKNH